MSAEKTRILEDIADLVRPLTDSLLPGEEITMDTRFGADLGLQSIALANLSGRMQIKYGPEANLVPFLATRPAGPIGDMRIGEVVDYLADLFERTAAEKAGKRATDEKDEFLRYATRAMRTVMLEEEVPISSADGTLHPARNENAAVLSELVPGVTQRVLQLPSGEVEVFMAGSGPAVIFMHPINVGVGVFARQFAELAGRYRVIGMHNPGVGATTWGTDVTLGGIARLYRTVLTELAVKPPFHVMGCSFGGIVAQEFVLQNPTECASLILAGCSYRAGARAGGPRPLAAILEEELTSMYADGAANPPAASRDEVEELLLRCESMDSRAGLSYLQNFQHRPSHYARLPNIAAPTLIMRGTLDSMVPEQDFGVLSKGIRGARSEELSGAGHFACLTHPAAVNALITPFLATHSSRQRTAGASVSEQAGPEEAGAPAVDRIIVVGTGRCGSTMLSDLFDQETETLSVSESISSIRGRLLIMPLSVFTGAQYWAMLSQPGSQHGHLLTRIGLTGRQYSYPETGRFAVDKTRVPPICRIALPKLTDDPDRLFDMLAVRVPQFPAQSVGEHHRMLLDLMAELLGRRRWIERTGASSMIAYPWLAANPDAKIVYLTRNTRDTALSMSKHAVFQLAAVRAKFHAEYGADPYVRELERPLPEKLPEEMERLLPQNLNAETLRGMEYDMRFFENMVEQMNGSAEQALADLQPKHLLRIRYEEILADPVTELTKLGTYIGFTDPAGWAAKVAGQVKRPSASAVKSG